MVKYETVKKVVTEKLYTGSHEEMVESYNNKEEFSKFCWGVIVTQEQLDEELIIGKDENGKDVTQKVSDKYHWFTTNDDRLFLTFMSMVWENAWTSVGSDEFYELADKYGVDNILTKSEMSSLRIVPEIETEI